VIEDEAGRPKVAKVEDVAGGDQAKVSVTVDSATAPEPRDCQVSFRLRGGLAREIREAAARQGISLRAFILGPLHLAGIGVREDDLNDRRRGGARGPRKRQEAVGQTPAARGSGPEVQLAEILKRAKSVLARGALQSGATLVIHVEAPAPEAIFLPESRSQASGNAAETRETENLRKTGSGFHGRNNIPSSAR
jgi:hypothetical protein